MAKRITDLTEQTSADADWFIEVDSTTLGTGETEKISLTDAWALGEPVDPTTVWTNKAFTNGWDGLWKYRVVDGYLEMFISIDTLGTSGSLGTLPAAQSPDWYIREVIIINNDTPSQLIITESTGSDSTVAFPDYSSMSSSALPTFYFKAILNKP